MSTAPGHNGLLGAPSPVLVGQQHRMEKQMGDAGVRCGAVRRGEHPPVDPVGKDQGAIIMLFSGDWSRSRQRLRLEEDIAMPTGHSVHGCDVGVGVYCRPACNVEGTSFQGCSVTPRPPGQLQVRYQAMAAAADKLLTNHGPDDLSNTPARLQLHLTRRRQKIRPSSVRRVSSGGFGSSGSLCLLPATRKTLNPSAETVCFYVKGLSFIADRPWPDSSSHNFNQRSSPPSPGGAQEKKEKKKVWSIPCAWEQTSRLPPNTTVQSHEDCDIQQIWFVWRRYPQLPGELPPEITNFTPAWTQLKAIRHIHLESDRGNMCRKSPPPSELEFVPTQGWLSPPSTWHGHESFSRPTQQHQGF
ncbi:uncharacterized protein B0I36DRAFT_411546 [Microdochium trichocladiopsis]|uniref:Uncharacterized protein n=1 Tax=Microdochium trichocladiopsis TaxID=1682393 RepID=A0A9P8Y323_9PEZI|nr:uncharacterized protein B0I36DRAFT_411546 [Microdochium trichocladiopsis]KAH7029564.1 hypothetical protein B0I36DRAFT_411546 [Microdochium trichocladiopsis]